MTDIDRKLQLKASLDATGVKQGVAEAKEAGRDLAQSLQQSGQQAAKGLDSIGDGAKRSADSIAREEGRISSQLRRLTQEAQTAGRTIGEKLEFKAQQLGPDAAGRLAPRIAEFKALEAAQRRAADEERALAQAQAATDAARASSAAQAMAAERARQAFVANLQAEAAAIGKTRAELLALKAAQLGVTAETAPLIAAIKRQEAAMVSAGQAANGLSQKQLVAAKRLLPAQITDIVTGLASGQPAYLVAIQQGGQLKDSFGGIVPAARAAGSAILGMINPLTVGAAAAVGLAVAFRQGQNESRAFADAITLSGNAAGLTEGRFNALTKSLADTIPATTIGNVREFAQALAATGEVGPQVFTAAAEAAARFGEATGKTADEVAKDFAQMGRDVVKWTAEHNRSLNFVSLAQYEQIKALQDGGRAAEAQGVVYDALNQRLRGLDGNLGTIDRLLDAGKRKWSEWWDAAKGIGRAETTEERLAAVNNRLTELNGKTPFKNAPLSASVRAAVGNGEQARQELVSDAQSERADLSRRALRESENASAEAQRAEDRRQAQSASDFVESTLKKAKAQDKLNEALKQGQQHIQNLNAQRKSEGLQPLSAADEKAVLDQIRKDNTPRGAGNEAAQTLRAQLEQQLRGIQDRLQGERDAVQFQQDELQALYNAGAVSLADFYDRKAGITADGVQKELAALTQAQGQIKAKIEEQKALDPKDTSALTRLQTQLNDAVAKEGDLQLKAANAAKLAAIDRQAAVRQMAESVREFQAQVLQMEGREFEAAQLRAQTAIERARTLAQQAQGPQATPGDFARLERGQVENNPAATPRVSIDVKGFEQQIDLQNKLQDAQRQTQLLSERASIAEERFALDAEARGLSLQQVERGIYDIRSKALEQLREMSAKADALANGANPDSPAVLFAERLRLELEKAERVVDPLRLRLEGMAEQTGANIAGGIEDALMDGDWEKAGERIGRELLRGLISDGITQPLQKELSNFLKGGIPGADGFAGQLVNSFTGLFTQKPAPLAAGLEQSVTGGAVASVDRDALRKLEAGAYDAAAATDAASTAARGGADALTKMATETAATTAVVGALPGAAASPLVASFSGVKLAADAAADALLRVAASSPGGDASALASMFGSSGTSGPLGSYADHPFQAVALKDGGVASPSGLHAFAKGGEFTNKVFDEPTLFKFANGGAMSLGVMGEAGEEAVMPLKRGKDGRLGIESHGGGKPSAPVVNVNVSGAPGQPKVTTRQRGNAMEIDIAFEAMRDRLTDEMANGGPFGRAMESSMGTRRAPALMR